MSGLNDDIILLLLLVLLRAQLERSYSVLCVCYSPVHTAQLISEPFVYKEADQGWAFASLEPALLRSKRLVCITLRAHGGVWVALDSRTVLCELILADL